MRQKVGCIFGLTLLTAFSVAQSAEELRIETDRRTTYFQLFSGQSITILGSEDRRTAFGMGIASGKREPRFYFRNFKDANAELVYEAYYDRSSSRGASGEGPNKSDSYGLLAYGRYRWPARHGLGLYLTAGWGVQYTNRTSVDLDSHINSTPMLGFGVSWSTPKGEASIGLRLLHISNAGTVGNNQGQNQLFLVSSWKF
ncbi:MAG TPA: acyloxyacyl hydrolase [Fimbriimonadaceae bacterium]|nr:acyloxyacyl hydrolase [Fimbriimonadaceae bacterium]